MNYETQFSVSPSGALGSAGVGAGVFNAGSSSGRTGDKSGADPAGNFKLPGDPDDAGNKSFNSFLVGIFKLDEGNEGAIPFPFGVGVGSFKKPPANGSAAGVGD